MRHTETNYSNNIFVFLITVSLCSFSADAEAEVSSLQENYGPQENRSFDPVQYRYSKNAKTYFTNFRGELNKILFTDTSDNMLAEMDMEYGFLFSPSNSGYLGFSYLSAKINNLNQIKLNSSLGGFIEQLDGEVLFSYRLLGLNQNYSLATQDNLNAQIYENSFSACYTRYSDTFLRETSLDYNFSTIPGEVFLRNPGYFQAHSSQSGVQMLGGYGNITTHEIEAQMAFGYEEIGSNLITGLKTSLGLGYEYVLQDELYSYSAETEESLSLLASIQQKTPFGLINTSYKHLDSSQTLYAGYSLQSLEIYVQETRYQHQKSNRLLGFLIKLDLWNPKDPFRKVKKLFGKNNSLNRGKEQIRHSVILQSNSFLQSPKFKQIIDS